MRSQEYIDHHRPIDALVGILLFPRARPPRRLHVSIVLLLGTLCTADLALAVGAGGARVSLPLVLFAVTECGYATGTGTGFGGPGVLEPPKRVVTQCYTSQVGCFLKHA